MRRATRRYGTRGDEEVGRPKRLRTRSGHRNIATTETAPDALISDLSIAVDKMNLEQDTQTPMLGGALGAMFPSYRERGRTRESFRTNETKHWVWRLQTANGVLGHSADRFPTEMAAQSAGGPVPRLAARALPMFLVGADTREGFASLGDALGGERVTVGGSRSFNPLEIQPTPTTVLDTVPDLDPWAEQSVGPRARRDVLRTGAGEAPPRSKQPLRPARSAAYDNRVLPVTQQRTTNHHRPSVT